MHLTCCQVFCIHLLLTIFSFAFNLVAEAEAAERSRGAGLGPGSTGGSLAQHGAFDINNIGAWVYARVGARHHVLGGAWVKSVCYIW